MGRFPQNIPRSLTAFINLTPGRVHAGIPSQVLANRPDIRQTELELEAAKIDVKVARAEFYPSLEISAAFGLQSFSPAYLAKLPESMLYSLGGDLFAPIINPNRLKAEYQHATIRQKQAIIQYERSILNACIEVSTEQSNISNLEKKYALKAREAEALTRSIDISNDLFKNPRADYLEVLMTQRDALESKLELVEMRLQQCSAVLNMYRNIGGGWQ